MTTYDTCSLLPLMVRLLIAHAASFCVWNSPCNEYERLVHYRIQQQQWQVCKTHPSEVMDDEGHELVVNHRLHLRLVACSDVGQEPHGFLQ